MVFVSSSPPAWKVDMDPMENQDPPPALATDLWLAVDALDLTERWESMLDELIEENAGKKLNKAQVIPNIVYHWLRSEKWS